jgi:hypothetical protein
MQVIDDSGNEKVVKLTPNGLQNIANFINRKENTLDIMPLAAFLILINLALISLGVEGELVSLGIKEEELDMPLCELPTVENKIRNMIVERHGA